MSSCAIVRVRTELSVDESYDRIQREVLLRQPPPTQNRHSLNLLACFRRVSNAALSIWRPR